MADTRQHAERTAVHKCRQKGGNACQAELWFQNNWGALAVSDGADPYFGTGYGTSEEYATSHAIGVCNTVGGVNCRVVHSGHTAIVNSEIPEGGDSSGVPDELIPLILNDILKSLEAAIGPAVSCGAAFTAIGPWLDHAERLYDISRGDLDKFARDFVWDWACLNEAPELVGG